MNERDPSGSGNPAPREGGILLRLRHWLRSRDAGERYLAEATDLAELERRMRALERANRGPAIVAFPAGKKGSGR